MVLRIGSWLRRVAAVRKSITNFTDYGQNSISAGAMEVTSSNFKSLLPEIESAIDSALFVSIDGEFTGLSTSGASSAGSAMDTPSERYERIAETARNFLLVQFGLCTFHYDEAKDKYTNRAYNFYVWPKPSNRAAPDRRFRCQTSSIDFLVSQNFDFNKLFRDGIPYLRPKEERALKTALTERQSQRRGAETPTANTSTANSATSNSATPTSSTAVPPEHYDFVSEVHSRITTMIMTGEKSFDVPKTTAYRRKLIYQTVRERFPDVLVESVVSPSNKADRLLRISVCSPEDILKKQSDRDSAEMDLLDDAVGFAKVVSKLAKSGRPVVGHNMLLDVLFTLEQFVDELPEEYEDFKALAVGTFPVLFDTKLMASTYPFKDEIHNSSLEELKSALSQSPYDLADVTAASAECGYERESVTSPAKYHEAGYDAFVTGLCFLTMANRLGQLSTDKDYRNPKTDKPRVMPGSALLRPFMNKLFLMRIPDIPYMSLSGDDPVPNRDHVFHVTFPAEWKTSDLTSLFSPFGYVQISWISDTTAFVSLSARECAPQVLSSLNHSPKYSIVPYAQFKRMTAVALPSAESGMTPMLERSAISFVLPPTVVAAARAKGNITCEASKKRTASPEPEVLKRSKSVSEDGVVGVETKPKAPAFDEPTWE